MNTISVEMEFSAYLDLLVMVLDLITLYIVVPRIWRLKVLSGWQGLFFRAAHGVLAMALGYQVVSCFSRLIGSPLSTDFQSGWALKDISFFMYVTAIMLMTHTARHPIPQAVPPLDFTSKASHDQHLRQ